MAPVAATTVRSTLAPGARVRSVQVPGAGEEPERSGRRRRHLGGELAAGVEQADVRPADRLAVTRDDALDDRFLGDVDPLDGQAAGRGAAHQAAPPSGEPGSSPSWTGTPTSEPHSVHEPS